jgi:hypothetical protein
MIRRPASDDWLLIPQAEHARIAGEIAAAWNVPAFGEIQPREPLLYAVAHHDDGWPEWEARPGVHADGRPINFDEMPPVESIAIWRRSIDRCAAHHPVSGFAVAGHFSALLQRFNAWKRGPDNVRAAAEAFLKDCEKQMDGWSTSWPGGMSTMQAQGDHAVAVLQLFDALSLWLCCQKRMDAAKFVFPGTGKVEAAPESEFAFALSPWPLQTPELHLSLPARQIPVCSYRDAADLESTIGTTVMLEWRLRPAGTNPES